jgi:hypothetical protein
MLPSAEALHLRRLRRNLFGGLSEQDLEGNRNPQGGAAEAEERAAAGRMKRPRSGARTKAGYITADTLQSKAFICVLARKPATAAVPFASLMTPLQENEIRHRRCGSGGCCSPARQGAGTGGKVSRISSMKDMNKPLVGSMNL